MCQLSSFAFVSSLAIIGCSTYSATLVSSPDAGVTGGTANAGSTATSDTTAGGNTASGGDTSSPGGAGVTGGAAATIGSSSATGGVPLAIGGSNALGGVTSTGGAPSAGSSGLGGASTTGGASASNGGALPTGGVPPSTGGTTSAVGTSVTIGGSSATGGAPSSGGASPTGGASSCTKDADCINPDPINCTFTCVNPGATGVCKPAATLTPTQCATTACDDRAISGFWDAAGNPHIAYGFTETDGSATIRMQQVKADGTAEGATASYKLAADQLAPQLLSANALGSKVGLLYLTAVPNPQGPGLSFAEFAITDLNGKAATPSELSTVGSASSMRWFRLDVTPLGAWLGLAIFHNPGGDWWLTTAGSSLAPWDYPDPVLQEDQFSATVVNNTLMLTGSDCNSRGGCKPAFRLQRYSATSLASVGSLITLSQTLPASTTYPTMGTVAGQAALLWTDVQSPGQLFRALINEDGTFAHVIDTVQSAISPRAVVESSPIGALLVGVITTGVKYQLVGQRLDSSLNLIGNPLALAAAQSDDVTAIEVHPSADGTQVLVTYRQSGARYRLIGTNLCGG